MFENIEMRGGDEPVECAYHAGCLLSPVIMEPARLEHDRRRTNVQWMREAMDGNEDHF